MLITRYSSRHVPARMAPCRLAPVPAKALEARAMAKAPTSRASSIPLLLLDSGDVVVPGPFPYRALMAWPIRPLPVGFLVKASQAVLEALEVPALGTALDTRLVLALRAPLWRPVKV